MTLPKSIQAYQAVHDYLVASRDFDACYQNWLAAGQHIDILHGLVGSLRAQLEELKAPPPNFSPVRLREFLYKPVSEGRQGRLVVLNSPAVANITINGKRDWLLDRGPTNGYSSTVYFNQTGGRYASHTDGSAHLRFYDSKGLPVVFDGVRAVNWQGRPVEYSNFEIRDSTILVVKNPAARLELRW